MIIDIWGLYTYFNISDMMYSHPHWTFSVSKMIKYLWDKKKTWLTNNMDTIWSSLQSFAESSVNFANLYNYVPLFKN